MNGQGLTDFHQTSLHCFKYYITVFIRYNKKWWKLAVETLQKSVKVCQSRLHSFHFPCSVIPYKAIYTHQPGKTSSLTASIVLFPDPLKTTSIPLHRIKPQSRWVFCYPSAWRSWDSSNCCPFLGQHCESLQIAEESYWLEYRQYDALF